jgi:hypothetical protein
MRPTRWRHIRELPDRFINSSPDRHAGIVADCSEFVGPPRTFLFRGFSIPPEHQAGGAPNVDFGYHVASLHPHGL